MIAVFLAAVNFQLWFQNHQLRLSSLTQLVESAELVELVKTSPLTQSLVGMIEGTIFRVELEESSPSGFQISNFRSQSAKAGLINPDSRALEDRCSSARTGILPWEKINLPGSVYRFKGWCIFKVPAGEGYFGGGSSGTLGFSFPASAFLFCWKSVLITSICSSQSRLALKTGFSGSREMAFSISLRAWSKWPR